MIFERCEAIEALASAWARIQGHEKHFETGKTDKNWYHYDQYLTNAKILLAHLEARGYTLRKLDEETGQVAQPKG